MKKKLFVVFITIILFFTMVSFIFFGVLNGEIKVYPSPNGDYEVVSWLIDKGAWGYGGAFYIKEKGLFSKCHKLGTQPFSGEWISETLFAVHHSYVVDDDYYREYNVNDYFSK